MWTPGHGPELRRARPTYGVDDVDEARFNPVCRRARGVEDDSDPSESDTGSDDDDDSHSSECDLVENVRQARLNALRRRRDDREEIRRQNETLERIHRARHAEREMAKELSSMRFEAERRHTLAWGDDAEVRDRERAARSLSLSLSLRLSLSDSLSLFQTLSQTLSLSFSLRVAKTQFE